MLLPEGVAQLAIAAELPAVQAFAERHRLTMRWVAERSLLVFDGEHSAGPIRITALTIDYPARPPAWRIGAPSGDVDVDPSRFPRPAPLCGKSSIFHSNRLICAPFNIQAYAQHNGPHGDWPCDRWREVKGHVQAFHITDMLAVILAHLRVSPGWN